MASSGFAYAEELKGLMHEYLIVIFAGLTAIFLYNFSHLCFGLWEIP